MRPTRFLLFLAVLLIPALALGDPRPRYTEDEFYDAKVLFAEFTKELRGNPDKAEQTLDAILELPDPLRAKITDWLDTEWSEAKRAYWLDQARAGAGGTGPRQLDASQKLVLKEGRDELQTIRQISDEGEMKKRLVADGWEALGKLVRTCNPAAAVHWIGSSEKEKEHVEPALAKALMVGDLRYKLRITRGVGAVPPREEIERERRKRSGEKEPTPEEKALAADVDHIAVYHGESGAILRANAQLKSQIPAGEYAGILELNHWRIAAGMAPLAIDVKLCAASRDHSKDMATHGFFAHDSPLKGKRTPWDRARLAGTSARAENIAINGSPSGANRAWFHSPGHHKNMFGKHSHVGLGIHGRHYTQMFR